jgi:hypothetical protein
MAATNSPDKNSKGSEPDEIFKKSSFFLPAILIIINLISCASEFGQVIISKPDEFKHTYEASEKFILNATARVFRDKSMGRNVKIDVESKRVDTDYIIQGDWRTRSIAKVNKLNWKETEVVLSVITEKKTETGWSMRRLLDKEQYINLFDTIDLIIYEEMSKIE